MDVSLDTKMRFVTPKKGRHPDFIIKCWHCGAEIGVVKQNSERWTRSEPEGRELTGDTATAIRHGPQGMYAGRGNGWLNRDRGPPVCLSMMHGGEISFRKSGQATMIPLER